MSSGPSEVGRTLLQIVVAALVVLLLVPASSRRWFDDLPVGE
ncbi:hypothetical protein [Micromonospora sp. S4605]|nr:hypothetical protein [Micromonospora sp. S4605]